MKILLTDSFTNQTIMIDTNDIISASRTASFTRVTYLTDDTKMFVHVAEPIHYIANACNLEFRVYYVKPGDILSEIAKVLGVSVSHLDECNPKLTNSIDLSGIQVLKY